MSAQIPGNFSNRWAPYQPQRLLIEREVWDTELARRIRHRLPQVPVESIKDVQEAVAAFRPKGDLLTEGKKILVIARQKGHFLKPCPGTPHYICCGYKILNVATNCDLECTYCILQGYLTIPFMVVYANMEDLFTELDKVFSQYPERLFRIGTGELADSLSLEHLVDFSRLLVPYFARQTHAVLELKTKTTGIDPLLELDHGGKVIVSWSLNPNRIIEREEKGTPYLEERLEAARRCQQAGYRLGFHFDPLIDYPGWERDYREVVDRLFDTIDPEGIVWISLGALRYPHHLEDIIRRRHPESRVTLGELFPGKDGKMRYFRPIRAQMFRKMVQWIKGRDPNATVYLCMESPEVWRNAFQDFPVETIGETVPLPRMLDEACYRKMAVKRPERQRRSLTGS